MLRPRIIPCLLIHNGGLIKSIGFRDYKYVGDPLNAIKIFNEMEADEVVVWDIDASAKGLEPDYKFISRLAVECRMPLCYGGGVRSLEQAVKIINLGVEKISISSAAIENPELINQISETIGRQSLVCVLDVKKVKNFLKPDYIVTSHNSTKLHKLNPVNVIKEFQERGAGEIVINSVDMDGSMAGYDMNLVKLVKNITSVPFTFIGGARNYNDMLDLIKNFGLVGCGAGSLFVLKGKYRSVLISYPSQEEKLIFRVQSI